jgi:hypothetical protein
MPDNTQKCNMWQTSVFIDVEARGAYYDYWVLKFKWSILQDRIPFTHTFSREY